MIFKPGQVNLITPNRSYPHQETDFEAETLTLLAAMTSQPNYTRQVVINRLIASLKTAGVWTLLDELWVFAAHDSQAALLGWKRYKNGTATSSPTFTTDRGYQASGGAGYVSSGFNPSTHGVNFTQNNCSFGFYSRTDSDEASPDMGCINTTVTQVAASNASGNLTAAVNITAGTLASAVANSLGFYAGRRTASNAQQSYRNGTQASSNASTSTALPNRIMTIGGSDGGAGVTPTTRQYAAAFVGASMSATNHSNFYTAIDAYMTSLGANV